MKAVVFHAGGDIRLGDVAEPKIQDPTDAIIRLTPSAICGTNLHFVRGTMAGMKPGTIGVIGPVEILSKREPMQQVVHAYEAFDKREPGWLKMALQPMPMAAE